MSEAHTPPKLFVNKPKKGLQSPGGEKGDPVPSATVRQPTATPLKKASLWSRYKGAAGALLFVNLGIGAYVLFGRKPNPQTTEKAADTEPEAQIAKPQETPQQAPSTIMAPTNTPSQEWVPPPPPPPKPIVSPEQQREILQWILEEKRKIKPRNKVEKAQINEEKQYLKKLIRGQELPVLS
jgi:type IV secretory pathway VirB10-like protein